MGTYGWLSFQQYQTKKAVKHKLKSSLDKSLLVALRFTAKQAQSELEWEHSKEFEYRGEMYDVVETEINGDTTTYWCWWDDEETSLNKQLTALVSDILGNNPNRNKRQKEIIDFYSTLFHQATDSCFYTSVTTETMIDHYPIYTAHKSIEQKSPPTPPPRSA